MKILTPNFHVVAETRINPVQIQNMIEEIGGPTNWTSQGARSGCEALSEVMGRLCYKSFDVGLNPNVTRVREGNQEYIGNILSSGHGSVLEHASTSVIFTGVTRVFTHEMVRHRPGAAFSQESLRFVRLTDIPFRVPLTKFYDVDGHDRSEEVLAEMYHVVTEAETAYQKISAMLGLDKMKSFALKKILTSSMRRIAPIGLSTNIGITANHRLWRHIIQSRTSIHAEEEVRLVIGLLAQSFAKLYPAFYQDMREHYEPVEDDQFQLPIYTFENRKV